MKTKNTLPFMLASTLFFVACGNKKPVETMEYTKQTDTVWLISKNFDITGVGSTYQIARLGDKDGKIYTQNCRAHEDVITFCANIGDKLIIESTTPKTQYEPNFIAIKNLTEEARLKEIIEKNR